MVSLANNTYFFPARDIFGAYFLIAILPSGANLLAYQVLTRKMYFYLRSRWFTDAAKNNVKQTQ